MTDDRILLHTSTSLLRACTRLLPFHLLLMTLVQAAMTAVLLSRHAPP